MGDSGQSSEGISSRRAMEDPSNPYFLHHSNTPGIALVSQVLTGENYSSWNRAMSISLSAKNKIGFVDGTIPKPDDPDLIGLWERNNHIAMSWILNSISKEISASIIYCSTASEMWSDLRDRFQQGSGPKLFQLKQELVNHKQGGQSVSTYFTKLKTIWEEINNFRPACNCNKCICGGNKKIEKYTQDEYTMSFLMGLNDTFSQVRSQILLSDPLPPINKAFALILQEEQQKGMAYEAQENSTISPVAYSIKTQNNVEYKTKEVRRNRPQCTYCNVPGHTQEKCYKLHGYPPGYQRRPSPSTKNRNRSINQISFDQENGASTSKIDKQDPFQALDKTQLQKLVAMLSDHLGNQKVANELTSAQEFSVMIPMIFLREKHPWNLIFLGLFTICISMVIGLACVTRSGKVILEAAALTAVVVAGLTLYTFWAAKRGHDFNFLGPFLTAALLVMILYLIVQIFLPVGKVGTTIYGCIAAIVFAGFIIYDTDNLIKRHSYDEYVYAAISLYLDIVNLFLSIVTAFSSTDS